MELWRFPHQACTVELVELELGGVLEVGLLRIEEEIDGSGVEAGGGVWEQDGACVDGVVGVGVVGVHHSAGCVLACGGGGWRCVEQVGVAVSAMPSRGP